ncbi:hypothetical protein EPO17_01715 [Patescibacteria group bacterium]|nr:MAG: hypothetical protein EPO17_01715 [Patescibacteria group bacterium]
MIRNIFTKKYLPLALVCAFAFSMVAPAYASLSSTNYQITSDSINFAGTEDGASSNYKIRDTGGEVATGDSTGIIYAIKAGYRQLVQAIAGSSNSGSSNTQTSNAGASGPAGQNIFAVQSIFVATGANTLLLDVSLNQPGKATLYWGLSNLYEGGSIASDTFRTDHVFKLEHLTPGTRYYFTIQAVNEAGTPATNVPEKSATTLIAPDVSAPSNPSKLVVEPAQTGAVVSWQNPTDADVESVKVVRSTDFYPADPQEGEVVYEGRASEVLDTKVLPGKTYYYTLFTKDVSGNYSSGAIAKIYITKPGEIAPLKETDIFAQVKPAPTIDPAFDRLNILDFLITQNNKMTVESDGKILLDGGEQFKIAIDYSKLPEVLKTMVVSIKDLSRPDEVFTFLLRVNRDKTKYEALVDKLGRGGNFAMVISILDHKHQGVKQFSGDLVVSAPKPDSIFSRFVGDPVGTLRQVSVIWWIILVALVLLVRKIVKFI